MQGLIPDLVLGMLTVMRVGDVIDVEHGARLGFGLVPPKRKLIAHTLQRVVRTLVKVERARVDPRRCARLGVLEVEPPRCLVQLLPPGSLEGTLLERQVFVALPDEVAVDGARLGERRLVSNLQSVVGVGQHHH